MLGLTCRAQRAWLGPHVLSSLFWCYTCASFSEVRGATQLAWGAFGAVQHAVQEGVGPYTAQYIVEARHAWESPAMGLHIVYLLLWG